MKWPRCFLLFMGIHFTSMANAAGADSSGGGELLGDRLNPWFMENTEVVRYCTVINNEAFSQGAGFLNGFVRDAFSFWKRQISLSQSRGHSFLLATQSFELQEHCDDNTDIQFLFGALNDTQNLHLPTPQDYVGVAIRTAYDTEQLRGKGFVYISPDNGPLRYRGENYMPGAWHLGDGGRLFYLIVHELGHVFGLPHAGGRHDIMGAGFPEYLVTNFDHSHADMYSNIKHRDAIVFDHQYPRTRCGYRQWDLRDGLNYLGIQSDCIRLVFNRVGGFDLYGGETEAGPWQALGTAHLHIRTAGFQEYSAHVAAVINGDNALISGTQNLPSIHGLLSIQKFGGSGLFRRSESATTRGIRVELLPNTIKIEGVIDGMSQPVLHLYL